MENNTKACKNVLTLDGERFYMFAYYITGIQVVKVVRSEKETIEVNAYLLIHKDMY